LSSRGFGRAQPCSEPFERRPLEWNLNDSPVLTEILVYTQKKWERLIGEKGRFAKMLAQETI
jgi:hypothetical protein